MKNLSFLRRPCALAVLGLVASIGAQGQTLDAAFAADYSVNSLGSVSGLPTRYGGLTFLDSNTLLIGGSANTASGRLYTVDVTRGADGHINGFGGAATQFGSGIGEFNDGGVVFGPGGVLFTSQWPVNRLGQTRPGSSDEDKVIDLAPLGVANSHAAINFVPDGFGGAGKVKLASWSGGQWYSGDLVADGAGTFDLANLAQVDLNLALGGVQNVPGGPEGFTYIRSGNAGFATNSMLISEFSANQVAAYDVDSNGDPLVGTRRTFLSGLTGAEGATADPLTGDFLFSTFGGANQVVVVSGFDVLIPPVDPPLPPPSVPIPEPATYALMLVGLGLVGFMARGRRRGERGTEA